MASNLLMEDLEESSDTLQYWLFPHDEAGCPIVDKDQLENISIDYLAFLSPYLHNYLWNCETFALNAKATEEYAADLTGSSIVPHIGGKVMVGDYLEDEWFCVFLLYKLTSAYPRLICRVVDSDGEFLLIEAAEYLPKWANPKTSEQRVYLKDGKLHLIPPTASKSSSIDPLLPRGTLLNVMDAVAIVNSRPSETLANPAVQKAIQLKIEEYPSKTSKDQHIAHAYVPLGVAALLREYPTLVSSCVRAFCRRDEKDDKILRVMRHFPPEQRVLTAVRFSKALYAQLSAFSYSPNPLTGWRLPPSTHPSYNSHILGMKLACGFEILVCKAGGVTPVTPSGDDTAQDDHHLNTDMKWLTYKQCLSENGYFRGEVDGSKLYTELETNARSFFSSNRLLSNKSKEGAEILSTGAVIIKLLSSVNTDYEFFKEREARLAPPDNENWLEITPDSLEQFLQSKYGKQESPSPSNKTSEQEALNTFFNSMSDDKDDDDIPPELREEVRRRSVSRKTSHQNKSSSGRKASSGLLSQHPQCRKISSLSNASEGSNASDMSSFSNKIDFNAESFTDALHNILELSVPEDEYWNRSDDDSSGMSSYDEEEEGEDLSIRKTSNGSQNSQASKASSGVDPGLEGYLNDAEKDADAAKLKGSKPKKKRGQRVIPLADIEDEFADVDHFDPAEIDMNKIDAMLQRFGGGAGGHFGSKSVSFGQIHPGK